MASKQTNRVRSAIQWDGKASLSTNEKPEALLHPAAQGKMAAALVLAAGLRVVRRAVTASRPWAAQVRSGHRAEERVPWDLTSYGSLRGAQSCVLAGLESMRPLGNAVIPKKQIPEW